MKFKIEPWPIIDLIKLYEQDKLNLTPPYQRNDIWPTTAKRKLIETIKIGYPLPSFFLHKCSSGVYDVVDGQQRSRALLGYYKQLIPDTSNKYFSDEDVKLYNEYMLSVTIIDQGEEEEQLEDFYYRVNKFGVKLNRPEILKAQYSDSPLQTLIEDIADSPEFQKLNLFTESTLKRMTDLDFVAELLTLMKYGITDKKIYVDRFYEDGLKHDEDIELLRRQFMKILHIFNDFHQIYPIHKTRYKQRNDFYTLFNFLSKHNSLSADTLNYFYKVLILIGGDISPTSDCFAFQEYATNCVSQSNSKRARVERLSFLEKLLLNQNPQPLVEEVDESEEDGVILDIMDYYNLKNKDLVKLDSYFLPNIQLMKDRTKNKDINTVQL